MPRYRLTVEYDGRCFSGWQRQAHAPSVQGSLERAAAELNGGKPVEVLGAGRTDAGVHAFAQVAHVDLEREIRVDKLRDAMNAHLRPDLVAVLAAEAVSDAFHARFSAYKRSYLYRIINRRADLTLDAGRAWRVPMKLDHEAMDEAARSLVGKHDFSTFRDAQCQAESPVKTLDEISVSRLGEEIEVRCSAPSFLHRQVRSIVGSLVEVGRGKESVGWIGKILRAADRARCGPVAPADGLYLTRVDYPDQ